VDLGVSLGYGHRRKTLAYMTTATYNSADGTVVIIYLCDSGGARGLGNWAQPQTR